MHQPSKLSESPDTIYLGSSNEDYPNEKSFDPEHLNSLGAKVPKNGGEFDWGLNDAYAFFFDKNDVIMYSPNNTHTEIQDFLRYASEKAMMFPHSFHQIYNVKRDQFNNISMFSKEFGLVGFINLPNINKDDVATLASYLTKNRLYFRVLDIRGIETEDHEGSGGSGGYNSNEEQATVPAGRAWIKDNLISFWNHKQNIMKSFVLVKDLLKGLKVDPKVFAYEFVDSVGFYAYSELTDSNDKREKRSPEEISQMLAQKHFKKDKQDYDSKFWRRGGAKAAKGFDYAAKASAARPAREGIIKLKDLITEIIHENAPPIADYDQYIKGMNKGMSSKTWFLNKIKPDCIVDFGCADGSVLKYIKTQHPDIKLFGYDIDNGMEKRFKQNNPDIPFSSDWNEAIKFSKQFKNNCVLLSSVIHEVYSYSQTKGHGVSKFWQQLFGAGFKYIVIRDTIPDRIDVIKPKDFSDDVAKVKSKVDPTYLADFEKKWGSIDNNYRLFVRFILTYRYKDNWDRESLENYMPLSYSTLLRKIPSNYKIIEGENYTFQPLAANFKDEYDVVLKVNTHLNMILERS